MIEHLQKLELRGVRHQQLAQIHLLEKLLLDGEYGAQVVVVVESVYSTKQLVVVLITRYHLYFLDWWYHHLREQLVQEADDVVLVKAIARL